MAHCGLFMQIVHLVESLDGGQAPEASYTRALHASEIDKSFWPSP